MRRMYGALSLLSILTLVSACAATRGEYGLMKQDLPKYGFLGEYYAKLQPGDPKIGQAEYMYHVENAEAIARKATKVLIDPVVSFRGDKSNLDPQDAQTLVNYLQNKVYEGWKDAGWEIVDQPGPDTLRFQVALSDAESRWVALDTIATVYPQLRAVGELRGFVTGKPSFVGAAMIEYKLVDAGTGQIIAAGYDRRVGGRSITKGFDKWVDVTNAMDYWRDLMKFRFCTFKGRTDCKAPKA